MKTTTWLTVGATALGMMIWLPTTTWAQDGPVAEERDEEHDEERHEDWDEEEEREIPFPSAEETLKFLKDEMPVAIEVLELVKKEEGAEAYEEVLSEFQERYHEYLEIRGHEGPEVAELFADGARLELRMDLLMHRFHEVAENDEDRDALRKEIHAVVQEQLEHEKQAARMELEMLNEHRQALEQELEELEQLGEDEIAERVAELLDDEEGEEDEEDDDDE